MATAAGSITITGNISGTVRQENNDFSIHDNHGTIVQQQSGPLVVQPTRLIQQPPRPVRGFINRVAELSKLESWIAAKEIVVLHGPDGIGKSALLKQAANSDAAKAMPNGVIPLENLITEGQALHADDIVQRLFNALFESNPPLKVDSVSARTYLSNTQPLILIDEVDLPQTLQKALPDLFPKGAILISTDIPFGSGFLRLSITPLPRSESAILFAAKAELDLNDASRAIIDKICASLDDVSLALVVTANTLAIFHIPLDAVLQALEQVSISEQDPVQAALNRAFAFAYNQLSLEDQKTLSAAALTPGLSIPPEWLSVASGTDVSASIERLKAIGLLVANSPRLRVPPGFKTLAQRQPVFDKDILLTRFIDFLLAPLANKLDGWSYIETELSCLLSALTWAAQAGRSAYVIRLGRAIDPYLTLHGLWDAWGLSTGYILDAARKIGDRAVEAWALHQIGTRAIGIGAQQTALEILRQALEIRRSLGDRAGMAYTQHNIDFLNGPPLPPRNTPKSQSPKPSPKGNPNFFLRFIGIGGSLAIIAFVIAIVFCRCTGTICWVTATPTPSATQRPTKTFTLTRTFTPTRAPTSTSTLTLTPTETPTLKPTQTETLTRTPTVTPTDTPPIPELNMSVEKERGSGIPILYQGDSEDYFEIPIVISIKNPGKVTIGFEFSLCISPDGTCRNGDESALFSFEDENKYEYKKLVDSIGSNESIERRANVKIRKAYEGKTINFIPEPDPCQNGGQYIRCNNPPSQGIKLPLVIYDFIDQANKVQWLGQYPPTGENFILSFGKRIVGYKYPGDAGFIEMAADQFLEDRTQPELVLYTHPAWINNGHIWSNLMDPTYELGGIKFEAGDQLVTKVGLIYGSDGDGVTFHLGCLNDPDSGRPYQEDLFLREDDTKKDSLEGQNSDLPVEVLNGECHSFYMSVDAGPTSDGDWAVWVSAYIARP